MAEIALDEVTKRFDDGTLAVSALDLDIRDGEFVVLVGPSGCGKTTALRMIAGLEDITNGEIRIAERVVNDLPPRDRDVAMVFQNYALYPHLNVLDNMAFALRRAKMDKAEIDRRVRQAARILGIEELLHRKPRVLSGGQRQRVAMGRAIVREPQAFLMDEPLSNLDAKLRVQMRAEIARIQKSLNVTTIYVTHDQVEAMTMGDRVAVLKRGELQQCASPQDLYNRPDNLFVAGFIGSPSMNFVSSRLEEMEDGFEVSIGGQVLQVGREVLSTRPALSGYVGEQVILGIRPQDFEDASLVLDGSTRPRFKARIDLAESLGAETLVHFEVDAPPVVTEDIEELAADVGGEQLERLKEHAQEGKEEFVAQVSPRTQIREGDDVELAVDPTQLHFFDRSSGVAIYD